MSISAVNWAILKRALMGIDSLLPASSSHLRYHRFWDFNMVFIPHMLRMLLGESRISEFLRLKGSKMVDKNKID